MEIFEITGRYRFLKLVSACHCEKECVVVLLSSTHRRRKGRGSTDAPLWAYEIMDKGATLARNSEKPLAQTRVHLDVPLLQRVQKPDNWPVEDHIVVTVMTFHADRILHQFWCAIELWIQPCKTSQHKLLKNLFWKCAFPTPMNCAATASCCNKFLPIMRLMVGVFAPWVFAN
jgi:hypothetical protein